MQEFSRPLGDAIKRARGELGFTQSQVADKIEIDAREVFNSEMQRESPAIRQLRFIIEECNEKETAKIE